ncbi:heavy metal translocating P-type ATPase [Phormidesmis priestleyi]
MAIRTIDAVVKPVSTHSQFLHYQIAHTVPGRFRIRVPRLGQDADYAHKLNWFVESLNFVTSVRINLLASSVVVYYEATVASETVQASLVKALERANTEEIPPEAIATKTEFRPEIDWLERLGLPVTSLGVALLVQQLALPIPGLLLGGLVTAAALPFLMRTVDTTIKEKRLDADILDALWITLYTVKGDFVAPALMVSLMESGEALRDTTGRANERQMLDLLGGLDSHARVERSGQEERIPLEELQLGDRVIVYPGERIPASGRVFRGTGLVDEHELTGESSLVSRSEGQVVHASTLLLEGKLCVLVKRVGKNTRVGLTVQLLQQAPVHDTRVEDYAAKLANMAIAPTLTLGGLIFALTGDVSRALAPLHLDFSHGIRLSVPTTVLSALTYAARNGIYIRSGRALEVLSRMDTIAFDKTGTLTQGNAAVVAIQTANSAILEHDVLMLAASVEQENTHPVAKAILRYAASKNIQTQPCETWDYRIGLGIVALIEGEQILVGSPRLMRREGVDTGELDRRYPKLGLSHHSLVYVSKAGKLLGVISYTDPLRPEASKVVPRLQSQGIDTYMLTGDNQGVARDVATKLGISVHKTYAEVMPQGKVETIQRLQSNGRVVAFIGEGINDAAALAHADVAISFASGSDLARETADVVLLDDDLRGVTHAIAIAKRAMDIVYQNTAIVAVPNISVVLAGIVFALDPILGVIISNGSMLLAELNSFRPLFDPGQDPFAREFDAKKPEKPEPKQLPAIELKPGTVAIA